MRKTIRMWLGIDGDIDAYRRVLEQHKREMGAQVQQQIITMLNQLQAQSDATARNEFAKSALASGCSVDEAIQRADEMLKRLS